MTADPTCTVEIAFDSDPLDESPTWTDVSADVLSWTYERGRPSEWDRFTAGTLELSLTNTTRTYDPDYSGGTYYGKLLPGKKIRLQIDYDGTTYDRFVGFIDAYQQEFDKSDNFGRCRITATDGFGQLARMMLPEDSFGDQVRTDSTPAIWYRFEETVGREAYDASGNQRHGEYFLDAGSASPAASVLPFGNGQAIEMGDSQGVWQNQKGITATANRSYELWVRFLRLPSDVGAHAYIEEDIPNNLVYGTLFVDYGTDKLNAFHGSGTLMADTREIQVGPAYHIVLNGDTYTTGTIELWVNGVLVATHAAAASAGTPGASRSPFVGRLGTYETQQSPIAVDEFLLHSTPLTDTQIADHYAAGVDPLGTTNSGDRLDALLDLVGWPSADRAIESGRSVMEPTKFTPTAMEYVRTIHDSEQGQIFIAADGKLTFRNRDWAYRDSNATTSSVTFSDNPSAGELPYVGFTSDYSRLFIRNVCRVSRHAGGTFTSTDSASVGSYGEHRETLTNVGLQPRHCAALADYVVARNAEPSTRVTSVTVLPFSSLADYVDPVLSLELGYRVTVERSPGTTGSAISADSWIQSIRESWQPGKHWSVTLGLSPAQAAGFWQLGVSTLGADTVLSPF